MLNACVLMGRLRAGTCRHVELHSNSDARRNCLELALKGMSRKRIESTSSVIELSVSARTKGSGLRDCVNGRSGNITIAMMQLGHAESYSQATFRDWYA